MRLGLDWSWDWGCGDSWPGARALTLRRGSLPLSASVAGARPIEVQPLALRLGTSLEFERSSWRAVSVPFWATEGCKNKVPAIHNNRLPVPLQAPEVVGSLTITGSQCSCRPQRTEGVKTTYRSFLGLARAASLLVRQAAADPPLPQQQQHRPPTSAGVPAARTVPLARVVRVLLQAPEVVGVVVLAREARATSLACAVDHLGRRGGSLSGIVWL